MRASPFIRWLARTICWLFYRVDRVGAPPASGPALLLPNHPNALLDPAIVWATAGRDVRFLAKSPLFEGPLRPLVAGAGAIPVYRRLDQGADVSKNAETFAAVHAALSAGDAICLFPEGVSHSTGRLVPLRTGAARMALAAEDAGIGVTLVPVGLNFERKTAFRSRVTVVYGPAFGCRDLLAQAPSTRSGQAPSTRSGQAPSTRSGQAPSTRSGQAPSTRSGQAPSTRSGQALPPGPAQVRALTDRIAGHMRNLLVEADPAGDAALVDRVDRLYRAARGRPRGGAERVARRRAIAAGVERLRARDPGRYDELLLRLRRYDQRLRRFGIRDNHLDWSVSAEDALRFAGRELLGALLFGPLAIAAMALFYVPYRLTAVAARWFTSEPDVAATAKVVGGTIVYAAWAAALVFAAWWLFGRGPALAAAAALPVIAVAGLFAVERESAVVDAVRTWFVLRRARHDTRERLRRHRSELADLLDQVNEWLQTSESADPV